MSFASLAVLGIIIACVLIAGYGAAANGHVGSCGGDCSHCGSSCNAAKDVKKLEREILEAEEEQKIRDSNSL